MISFSIIFYIIGFILLYSFIKKNTRFSKNDPPLCAISLPIIGGLYKLGVDPSEDLLRLSRKFGKIMSIWYGDNYTVIINDPGLIEEAFNKNHEAFGDRPFVPSLRFMCDDFNDLVLSNYTNWKPLRQQMIGQFTRTKLKAIAPAMETHSNHLVRKFKEHAISGEPLDPVPYLRKYTFSVILKMVLNIDMAYEEEPNTGMMLKMFTPLSELVRKMAAGAIFDTIHALSPIYYKIAKRFNHPISEIKVMIRGFIKEHKETIDIDNPRDFLDMMISNQYEDDLIVNLVFDLLLAGVETSATTLSWFVLLMANYQEEQEKVRSEVRTAFPDSLDSIQPTDRTNCPYTSAVIKESMRLKPIGPFGLPRISRYDTMIGEYFIPKGTQVMANFYAVLHDHYPNGTEFNPSRYIGDHSLTNTGKDNWMPFSIGPRACLGSSLAIEEIWMAVAKIFSNVKVTSIDGSKLDETSQFGMAVQPLHAHKYKFEIVK
ncbi:cytochrome P450 family protein [Cavenderia fasciculata]|uniref:Cytochrome P450 family protein n=1 Tax=Cavenderia fasciculata TaxID=261658 RepID=F4PGR6_CACFS|nr:cytochrome P450 family protein [Cavenderia fasciculata]EGG24900.1 cytochrome P450 family protein [Cavenderia fasciculata]|eukprot:XP_004362751.1 cytochrome P450 family protein [Cavenderia fasciculata]